MKRGFVGDLQHPPTPTVTLSQHMVCSANSLDRELDAQHIDLRAYLCGLVLSE